ncbi:SpoIIE family protein phosphatase [Frankia sp. AgB1.9]|uniref:SpoIIE family protein phosphatase n=1 Tax=unclassified Frankia TaxID=2632575 RepID=UPI0019320593|nr:MULTISPECIES: SpoIIE family protein phosphatase [unclassified Frankia]MBL7488538.1 SpoIIE family protein phosphatase [Frankia sp. AgW1.1]MBL7550450.1 SpoIIE family protein phosphatase [Frankia sp. AgB1.9]MBL7620544.1 SpoIIE family protein phosphatase [Frankia sp. AgB1.8]
MANRFEAMGPGTGWELAQAGDLAQDDAEVGIWDRDVLGGRLTWDRRTAELHGVRLEDFGGTMDDFYATIHPDDLPKVQEAVETAIAEHGSYLSEYRVARPDGSQAWIQGIGRVVANTGGRSARVIGLVVDVTWRRAMVDILQRAILPQTLPQLFGIDLVARYLPAARDAGIGGDWYDANVLPDGAILLVVGDVAGHGLPAVAAMAELRHAARAYALAGYSPAGITTQLSANLAPDPDATTATAVVAHLDPATHRLTWSCAGHPPPLLVTGSDVHYLDDVHGPLLGVDPTLSYGQTALSVPPDARLLLYTDGLVERRDASLTDRLDILADVAADHARLGLGDLCDGILADVAGDVDREDDVCLLAVQAP